MTTTSEPYLSPCTMPLISQTRKAPSKLSSVFPGRHKSLRSCCNMSVIAVTLSDRTQGIQTFVSDLYPSQWPTLTRGSGKRFLKNTGIQVDKKIEEFRTALLELRKVFLDEASITTEITALQILDDVGIISATVGKISSHLDGMATQLKWVSSQVSDTGT